MNRMRSVAFVAAALVVIVAMPAVAVTEFLPAVTASTSPARRTA